MENKTKFYPNKEYNKKKRVKYFVLFAVLVTFILMMDAWFIAEKYYFGLIMNAFLILFVVLTPKTLKETPVDGKPVLEIFEKEIKISGKTVGKDRIRWVKAIVYLGSVGNAVENREFLNASATDKPPMEMTGSFEVAFEKDGKVQSEFVIFENIVEALLPFVKEGKTEYRLGYSLGKEYRVATYNLKELLNEEKPEAAELTAKQKMKQLI